MPSTLDCALAATEAHISVIPVGKDKKPTVKWAPLQKQRMSVEEVHANFSNGNRLGLICGEISENLEVIDFDQPGFFERWAELLADSGHQELYNQLVIQTTPSGGFHAIYRSAAVVQGNQKLAMIYAADGKPEVAIETRGEGGYIVAFPSAGYTMFQGSLSNIATVSPEQREALLHAAKILDEAVEYVPPVTDTGRSGGRPGDVFNDRASWHEVLDPHGWRFVRHLGNREHWCRPGKEGRDTSATTGNGFDGRDLLKVFTSNAYPLELDGVYNKFSAYAVLNHGGDFSVAAGELAKQGYGDPILQVVEGSDLGDQQSSETAAPTPGETKRFRFFKPSELATLPEKEMFVRGLLGRQDRWMYFGRPGCGKSFAITDFLVCCAVGGIWAGTFESERPLKVVYCSSEGKFGFPRRLKACVNYHELDMTDIEQNMRVLFEVPQLFDTNGQRSIFQFAKELKEEEFIPDIFVLDTLNKAALGSKEVDNSEAAIVCDTLATVSETLDCSPGLVHHTGWGQDHPRGASAYLGDMDLVIRQDLDDETKDGQIHLYKGKDILPFENIHFGLRGYDGTAVMAFKPVGFQEGADDALAMVTLVMADQPQKEWWTVEELARASRRPVDAVRMACKREDQRGYGRLIEWDKQSRPASYRRTTK